MAKFSFAALASFVFVSQAVFLVRESSSFHHSVGQSSARRLTSHLQASGSLKLHSDNFDADNQCHNCGTYHLTSNLQRRAFLTDMLSGGVTVAGAAISASTLLSPSEAVAAGTDVVSAGTIKVTPIAHTFLTTGGTPSPKPVRENDATRYFTNARVVYLFDGKDGFIDNLAVAEEVTELTTKRKAERGPGVTPGNVQTLAPSQLTWKGGDRGTVVPTVVEAAKQMADGDVLLVGPIPTGGTADDGKLLASTAYTLGTFVGGKKEQGVISVLLNGPKENLKLSESGFPVSELLWYSLPPKKK